jgi:hypothetical protein
MRLVQLNGLAMAMVSAELISTAGAVPCPIPGKNPSLEQTEAGGIHAHTHPGTAEPGSPTAPPSPSRSPSNAGQIATEENLVTVVPSSRIRRGKRVTTLQAPSLEIEGVVAWHRSYIP